MFNDNCWSFQTDIFKVCGSFYGVFKECDRFYGPYFGIVSLLPKLVRY